MSAPSIGPAINVGISAPDSVWNSLDFHLVNEGPVTAGQLNSLPAVGEMAFSPVQTEAVPVSSVVEQAQEVAAAAWAVAELKPILSNHKFRSSVILSETLVERKNLDESRLLRRYAPRNDNCEIRTNIGMISASEADIRQAQVVEEAFNKAGVDPQISQKLVSKALAHSQSVVNNQTETRTQTQNQNQETEVLTEQETLVKDVPQYEVDEAASQARIARAESVLRDIYNATRVKIGRDVIASDYKDKDVDQPVDGSELAARLGNHTAEEKSRLLDQLGLWHKPDGSFPYFTRDLIGKIENLQSGREKIREANDRNEPVKKGKNGRPIRSQAIEKVLNEQLGLDSLDDIDLK